jgi:hypothetical protein
MGASDLSKHLTWLDSMASWPDGWNSYDALAPRKELIEKAKEWLTSLHGSVGRFWLAPNITGTGEGGVIMEWWSRERKVSVYIEAYDIWCLKVWGSSVAEMEENDASLPGFVNVWYWLRANN